MKLVTVLSGAALAAIAHAKKLETTQDFMDDWTPSRAYARITNRCPYDVYVWSILKTDGCRADNMVKVPQGGFYAENLRNPQNGVGVSIKISKTTQCKPNDITQLEYYLETQKEDFLNNFLDVSYVDCLGGECPTINEGYYLKAGNQSTAATTAQAGNTICPILTCTDRASCSKISYVLPDDVQTRSCPLDQSIEFYMCGGQPPSADDNSKPSSSSPKPDNKPSSAKPATSAANVKVNAAAVTPAPEIKEPKPPKIKTNVVYVTKYEYVNAKRHDHAHAHARRHQNFHA